MSVFLGFWLSNMRCIHYMKVCNGLTLLGELLVDPCFGICQGLSRVFTG